MLSLLHGPGRQRCQPCSKRSGPAPRAAAAAAVAHRQPTTPAHALAGRMQPHRIVIDFDKGSSSEDEGGPGDCCSCWDRHTSSCLQPLGTDLRATGFDLRATASSGQPCAHAAGHAPATRPSKPADMLRSIQGMRMALKRLEQQKAATGVGGPAPAGAAAHALPDSAVLDKQAALQAQARNAA